MLTSGGAEDSTWGLRNSGMKLFASLLSYLLGLVCLFVCFDCSYFKACEDPTVDKAWKGGSEQAVACWPCHLPPTSDTCSTQDHTRIQTPGLPDPRSQCLSFKVCQLTCELQGQVKPQWWSAQCSSRLPTREGQQGNLSYQNDPQHPTQNMAWNREFISMYWINE